MNADAGQTVCFAQQAIIRCSFELRQCGEFIVVFRQTAQNTFGAVTIGNETMGVVLMDWRESRLQRLPRRASSNCRTRMSAGTPPRIMYANGVSPSNIGFVSGN